MRDKEAEMGDVRPGNILCLGRPEGRDTRYPRGGMEETKDVQ